ncbi:multiubiquitin domain-containing protein [Comamonas sp. E6]|uniref:multiubiquitin domain-containing protein n=1 Tax=Comamonas sp. E6 TaxID=364029 RepID=UPI0006361037|nr:multiubiquitin domain-containing protein [Comamonas sp. E6]GAO73426.1 hypothetical protein CSE6_038_48630 [Comamonas sp. E6]
MNTQNQPTVNSQHEVGTHELHLISDEQCIVRVCTPPNAHEALGKHILSLVGRPATSDQIVLQLLHGGGMESIRLDERINLALGNTFVISSGDRVYRFTIDGKSYEWPHRFISGELLQMLAGNHPQKVIELIGPYDAVEVAVNERVDLTRPGVETFKSRIKPQTWTLSIQGVLLEYTQPEVKVADAMVRAGYDPNKSWHIYLIVHGQPKQEITGDFVVDLRQPGIEKIRLMLRDVNNGECNSFAPTRAFQLLPKDHQFLDALGLKWETVIEHDAVVGATRRWLLIHDYSLLGGYSQTKVQLALEIVLDYPAAQIDMFYFLPFVTLINGQEVPSTQVRATIKGATFQGWSRHRSGASAWDPNSDCVQTQLALVESCMVKELSE